MSKLYLREGAWDPGSFPSPTFLQPLFFAGSTGILPVRDGLEACSPEFLGLGEGA